MWIFRAEDALGMDHIRNHEDLMQEGVLFVKDDKHSVMFVSHCWLGRASPDHQNKKWTLLKDFLRSVQVGAASFTYPWRLQTQLKPEQVSGYQLQRWIGTGYMWLDYCSIPQLCAASKGSAVLRIPYYISVSDWFIVLQPAAKHESGVDYDVRTWAGRGWCRMERLINMLSPSPKQVLVVESKGLMYIQPVRDWLLEPVARGHFTIPNDKLLLGPVLEEAITRRRVMAVEQGDMLYHRMLLVIRDTLMDGTNFTGSRPLEFDAWMENMGFKTAQDEETTGWTPLRFALYDGRLDIARELIARGASVHAPLKHSAHEWGWHLEGISILGGLCLMRDFPEGVTLLLEHKADPYICDRGTQSSAATCAAGCGRVKTVKLFMRRQLFRQMPGTSNDVGFFARGILSGHLAVTECIAKDVVVMRSIRDRCGNSACDPDFRDWLSGAGICCTALLDVGNAVVLHFLIDTGYDINAELDTSQWSWMDWAIAKQAQVLHTARSQHDNVAEWLAHTPLSAVRQGAMFGNVSAVKLCIKAKADLARAGGLGRTPLHLAALKRHAEVVELLLEASAPVECKDVFGRTPYTMAASNGDTEISDLLRRYGDKGLPHR